MSHVQVAALIQGLQRSDPRLYDILRLMSSDLEVLVHAHEESLRQAAVAQTPGVSTLASPTIFIYTFTPLSVRFNWTTVEGASEYEIRNGSDWDTATLVLRTPLNQADISPITLGTHRYLIKALNSVGYSATATILDVVVPDLGTFSITTRVIDNNVLLSWSAPTSTFRIEAYLIYKNNVLVGEQSGTFTVFFEPAAGSYTYKIIPRDIAGNLGPPSEIIVEVNAPPDYVLQDSRIDDFTGTKVNVYLEGSRLVCCTPVETWQEHFVNRLWQTIQDQLDDGYTRYAQPSAPTGSYEHVIDYGTVLNNIIVNLAWQTTIIVNNVTVVTKVASSTDNISYTAFTTGTSVFVATMRYLKVRVEFTATL